MEERDLRRITEAAYLNQENTHRYRAIVHFCYQRHIHMQTFVYPVDIYNHMMKSGFFSGYTEDNLEQDLNQLVEWNNLKPQQETSRALTINDFKRKRYRYRCTPYTVEIEQMLENLKKIGDEFGGSLESTRFDRIYEELDKLLNHHNELKDDILYQSWSDLENNFKLLVKNSSDYLAHLKSVKIEDRAQLHTFLIYKDKFTNYLNDFILELQKSSVKIEQLLKNSDNINERTVFFCLADHSMSVVHFNTEENRKDHREDFMNDYYDRFSVIKEWFLGNSNHDSEINVLYSETVETIRRITRFAQRLAEERQSMKNRHTDYLKLANWFAEIDDVNKAAMLASVAFGAMENRHFVSGDDFNASTLDLCLVELDPDIVLLKERTRGGRERVVHSVVQNNSEDKRKLLEEYVKKQKEHELMMDELVHENFIDFSKLPKITAEVRENLLDWVTRCIQVENGKIQTETGRKVRLIWDKTSTERIKIECEDGILMMPPVKLEVRKITEIFSDQEDSEVAK